MYIFEPLKNVSIFTKQWVDVGWLIEKTNAIRRYYCIRLAFTGRKSNESKF